MEGGSTATRPAVVARGILVFAQPLIVAVVVVWLLNDHVFKDRYGSWWTGKLSDVAGLIIFPLVLAVPASALSQGRLRYPLGWAIGFTTLFFGSINLVPAADRFAEISLGWLLGHPVVLTMDPTDLLTLPSLAVPIVVWSRVASGVERRADTDAAFEGLRRSWGRVMFGVAAATTLATSPNMAESEVFTGTVFFDDTTSSIDIPFSLTLDGDPAEEVFDFLINLVPVPYGGPIDDRSVIATHRIIEPGQGLVTIEVQDPSALPMEVRWSAQVMTEGEVGLAGIGGSAAEVPVLEMTLPSDTFGPEPLVETTFDNSYQEPWQHRFRLEAAPGATATLAVTGQNFGFRVATEDEWLIVSRGEPYLVTRPARCEQEAPSGPCQFDVLVSELQRVSAGSVVLHAAEPANMSLLGSSRTTMESRVVAGQSDAFSFAESVGQKLPIDIRVDLGEDLDPMMSGMSWIEVQVRGFVDPETVDDGPDDLGAPWLNADYFPKHLYLDECCGTVIDVNGGRRNSEDWGEWPVVGAVEWRVTLWTPAEVPADVLTVSVG